MVRAGEQTGPGGRSGSSPYEGGRREARQRNRAQQALTEDPCQVMSENQDGMAVEFTKAHAETYGVDGEAQRFARTALCNKMSTENQNVGMAVEFTRDIALAYGEDSEAQRFARTALINIASTLSGMTAEQADSLRQEYCRKFPKAKLEAERMKSRGTDDSMMTTAKWPGDIRPPLLREFNMAADLVFKLRKLGVLAEDVRLDCRFAAVSAKHAEKYAGRE